MKTIARLRAALLALATLATVTTPTHAQKPTAPAAPTSKPVFRQEGRNIADAPTLSSLKAGGQLQGNWVAETDSFPLLLNGFQDLAGNCAPRGWIGQDRTDLKFAHVSDKAVTNRPLYAGLDPLFAPPATLPAPNDRYALDNAYGVALNDSGAVIISAVNGGPHLFAAYPGAGVIREFGGIGTSMLASPPIAFDPLTGGVFAVYSGRLWLTPAGGGGPVALNPETGSSEDTTLAAFSFTDLRQMVADPAGNLYWVERLENRVRVLRRNDLRVVTVVGTGLSADNGVGIPARSYNLYSPSGLALTPDGNTLYVADGGHSRLIRVQAPLDPNAIVEFDDAIGFNEEGWPNYLALSGDKLYMGLGYNTLGVRPLAGGPFAIALGRGALYAPPADAFDGGAHTIDELSSIVSDGAGGIYMGDAGRNLVIRYTDAGQVELVAGYLNPILMGTRALRVGADMESHPAEVANWVRPQGFGNDWSQRLISPPIPVASLLAGAVLNFDITVELEANALAEFVQFPFDGQFIAVQCEMPDGTWRYLIQRVLAPAGGWTDIDAFTGQGTWRVQVPMDATLGNSGILPASGDTRLRIVVQSNPLGSSEDGFVPGGTLEPRAAAVLDNISLRLGAADLIAFTDFEDGSLGPWTTAAYNAFHAPPGVQQFYSRDGAPAGNIVQTQSGFDAADPSCVWTFTGSDGQVALQTLARLTSPWIPLADATREAALAFSGKLPLRGQARVLNVWVRGKNSGDARPAFASPSNFIFFYVPPPDPITGIVPTDGDYLSPFFKDRVVRFPTDFQFPNQADSVQFIFQVEGRYEQFISQNFGVSGGPTALPFFDDLKVYQFGVDQDFDGVADAVDACPTEPGAGQDGDGDGCPAPTATLHNAESWSETSLPLALRFSQGGLPGAADAFAELDAALATWTSVPGAQVPVTRGADTPQVAASPMDGVNLVTFADDSYPFAPEVLGVTPTLSALQRTSYNDRIVLPGEIVDADVIFNPRASFRTPTKAGSYDLRSVATHELGHLLGLSHSGVSDATMFFVQQPGQEAASLTQDDRAAIAATYPDPATFGQGVGSIKGTVMRGGSAEPVAGALVTAVALDGGGAPRDTVVSDYTDERGRYSLYQLPPGDYGVHVQALDGQVLYGLIPDYISLRMKAISGAPFDAEWHSDPETDRDDPALKLPLAVAAGTALTGIDVTTNADTIPPTIVSVDPVDGGTDAAIDAAVQVTFSEGVDGGTIASSFGVYPDGSISRLEGNGYLSGDGLRFVFTPSATFAFDTPHTVRFTTALKDRRGTALEAEFNSTFTTQTQPPVAITALTPNTVVGGTQLTITGSGFDPAAGASNIVVFERLGAPVTLDSVFAGFVTPTSLVAQVPVTSINGNFLVRVVVNEQTNVSNDLNLTVVPPPAQASPTASGSAVPVGFALNDVAVTDAGAVFAAGDGGLVYIGPAANSATTISPERTQSVALTPDGRLLVASQPGRGRLQVFDADPNGTPGTLLATIPVDGTPFGVAVSPTGQRAYATDEDTTIVHEIDLRAGSATRFSVVGVRALPPGAIGPNGGIAVDPRNDRYYLTTATGTWSLANDGSASLLTSAVGTGVAATPSGAQVIVPITSGGLQVTPAAAIATGGSPRDAAVTPLGQSALVANSVLNQLQVVDLTPSSPTYLKVVGDSPTGDTPVAVSLNNRGDIVAVANRASRTVSRYTLSSGTTPALQRVVGDVAMPGEIVGIQGDDASNYDAGTQVDLGGTLVTPTALAGSGSALAARIPVLPQRQTSLTVQRPDGTRSLSLPFTVVEPVVSAVSRSATSIALPDTSNFGEPATYGQVGFARVSPDGRRLAVMQQPEIYMMSLFAIGDDEPAHGRYLGAVPAGGTAGDATWDAAFSPDGRALWINSDSQVFRVIDADPASGTFGQILASVLSSGQAAVVADPLGRYMITANRVDNQIPLQIWTPTADTLVAEFPINADGLAASPDGRLVLAQADFQMHFLQLEPPQLLQTYTKPGSTGDAYEAVAVTRDGRYGFAIGNPRGGAPATFFTVWNLDPQFGPVGQVVYSKAASEASPLDGRRWREAWPGPTTSSIVLGATDGTVWIVGLQPSGAPVATLSLTGIPDVQGLAVTPGARRLYLPAGGRFTSTPGRLEVLNLTDATRADLVSGDGQSGLAGTVLPSPVRVRVTDGAGRPQFGVLVRFELGVNGGAISGSPGLAAVEQITDANGEAEVFWQLPAFGPTLLTSATMDVRVLGVSDQPVLVATARIAQDDSQVAPVVLQLSPADGATGLNATTPVAVRFNQKMAPAVTDAIQLKVNDTPVQGTFKLEDEGRLVLFQPFAALPFGAGCRLSVAGGVAFDTDNQRLEDGASAAFTVQAAPAVNVTTITPPSGPAGAAVVIGGTAFSTTPGGNAVLFNGASAVVSDATASALTASVPLAATTGPVQVVVGNTTATGPDFVVLPANPVPGGAVGDLQDVEGIREMAVTADGSRGYVTNPTTNTVTALDLLGATTITRITVGLKPQGVAILPEPQRAYVANTGSNNLSVIDVDPASPTYHTVVKSIAVEEGPIDVVVSPVGPRVYVLNQTSGSLSVIDANSGNATYDQVVTTVKTGSGGQNVAVSPDGTVAYIAAAEGLIVVDLQTNAVVTTVKTGTGGQNVAVSPDGTIVLLLLTNGDLLAISVAPGASQYQVVTTVKTGSGGQTVAVSPDGTLAYVTDGDGDQVLVFQIVKGTTADASTFLPVPSLSLVLVATIPVGEAPSGIAFDPTGERGAFIVNSGSGTITRLGGLGVPQVAMRFDPRTLNIGSAGNYVTVYLEPQAPYEPEMFVIPSIRLNGTVPVDTRPGVGFGDYDGDGVRELRVKFLRKSVERILPVAPRVPLVVTGTIEDSLFTARDTITVNKGGKTKIGALYAEGGTGIHVTWPSDEAPPSGSVAILRSFDRGATWAPIAEGTENDGVFEWQPEEITAERVRFAVTFAGGEAEAAALRSLGWRFDDWSGTVWESDDLEFQSGPAVLTFAPITPNPSRGVATLRFGLPSRARVTLEIFDLQGRRVRTVFDGEKTAGWHAVSWKGDHEGGGSVGAGLYFARLKTSGRVLDQRLVLIR